MIVVVSDTHCGSLEELPKSLVESIRRAEVVVHAGDFDRFGLYEDLKEFDLVAVAGNSDEPSLREILPETTVLEYEGRRIAVKHEPILPDLTDLVYLAKELEADAIVFGHTHRPVMAEVAEVILLNPGSPTRPRYPYPTFLELYPSEIVLRGVDGEDIERIEW